MATWRTESYKFPGVSFGTSGLVASRGGTAHVVGDRMLSFAPPLAKRWDGTGWMTFPLAIPGPPANAVVPTSLVNDVDGHAHDDLWAVGSFSYWFGSTCYERAMICRWNGVDWSFANAYNAGDYYDQLLAVCARHPRATWAVGITRGKPTSERQPLAQYWDGSNWRGTTTPAFPGENAVLRDVAAMPDGTAWAVGYVDVGTAPARPLAMFWDGSSWVTHNPSPPNGGGAFESVVMIHRGEAWAFGTQGAYPSDHAYVCRWNGSNWREWPLRPIADRDLINGAVAVSDTDIVAVGGYEETYLIHPFVWHWDGSIWREEPVPDIPVAGSATPPTGTQYFHAASHADGTYWAAGILINTSGQFELLIGRAR